MKVILEQAKMCNFDKQHDGKMYVSAQHIRFPSYIHLQFHAVLVVISQPCLAEEDVQQAGAFISDLKSVRVPPVSREGWPEP